MFLGKHFLIDLTVVSFLVPICYLFLQITCWFFTSWIILVSHALLSVLNSGSQISKLLKLVISQIHFLENFDTPEEREYSKQAYKNKCTSALVQIHMNARNANSIPLNHILYVATVQETLYINALE